VRIIAFDPSTNDVGVAFFTINDDDLSIEHIDTYTIVLQRITNMGLKTNDLMTARLNLLRRVTESIVRRFKPDICVYENPFIDKFKLGSAIPLGKSIGVIETVLQDYNNNMHIIKFSPRSVKKYIDAKKIDDKLAIKEAINRNLELTDIVPDLNGISEHEADAIAIAYSFYLEFKANPLSILT